MATKFHLFSFAVLLLLLCLNVFTVTLSKADTDPEEDLTFLQDGENDGFQSHQNPYNDFENYDDLTESYLSGDEATDESPTPAFDESDVVVLKESNFTYFVARNKYVLVEFYAPWCGHCKALAPEFAAAATELKEGGVAVLAKVDANEETELAQKYDVEGFPTLLFFVDGVQKSYPDQRTKEAIVTWVKKKTGPSLHNLTDIDEAERILTSESKIVLGFLGALVGPESEELADASKLEDDVNFYQSASPDVAKLFHIDPQGKRPALVMIKKEAEKITHFGDQFITSAIVEFVSKNKLPLVTNFTRESGQLIFENPIKKQLILFANSDDYQKFIPKFKEAAKVFMGKIIFVYVDLDNEDVGKQVSEYFGVTGNAPRVIAFTGNEDDKKFVLEGELTLSSIQSFGEKFLEDNLKPFYKSDPIPETNDGDVKIVVGNNFDDIVLDESKDVLLEIYAPWCGHCQALEPIYNKLGKHLRGIDSLVIAKMDGTTNEHPRAKSDGFPTLLFFPAGNKSFDPITVETDRTVVAFYKFLKQNAAIPFKLKKPTSTQKSKVAASDVTEAHQSSSEDVKDEL